MTAASPDPAGTRAQLAAVMPDAVVMATAMKERRFTGEV